MSSDFVSKKKYKCVRCGRKVESSKGMLTSYAGKFPPWSFLCLKCLRELDKDQANQRRLQWERIAKSAQTNSDRTIDYEAKKMHSILTELCPQPGWYSIRLITDRFNSGGAKNDCKYVSRLLKRMGFTARKRLTRKKIVHVYIDLRKT